jgi:3-hydroxyacyl-CoA dehydrogenase/enoyl-CoA hydratase/3-hydroxybutyryl-CoA epimerase/3-hydroxyacyl-CoA dehydrogenase/enoyl-CoA hydratase/3-hydroxybutyryl-CoA epimerase/enoyl-CoA isomerase
MWEAYPDRTALTPVLPALVKRNRLGIKTGSGFYRYEPGTGAGVDDPEFSAIIQPYIRQVPPLSREEIARRLFLPMLLEATRLLEEGVVQDVRDIDVGVLHGLAFPEGRGGLLYWADQVGAPNLLKLLEPFHSLGPRMQPTALLRAMAESGESFYPDSL